jgi:hypothetical protein
VKRALALLLVVAACGPTIGDPCTTAADCLNAACLNNLATPGGYCSLACNVDAGSCPVGSLCIRDGIRTQLDGCFRTCMVDRDCRNGYVCRVQRNGARPICIGPNGL